MTGEISACQWWMAFETPSTPPPSPQLTMTCRVKIEVSTCEVLNEVDCNTEIRGGPCMPMTFQYVLPPAYRFSSNRGRVPEAELIAKDYQLVRVTHTVHGALLLHLERVISSRAEVACVMKLHDNSFEVLVRTGFTSTLEASLKKIYDIILDSEYDPFQPTEADVVFCGVDCARALYNEWFKERAKRLELFHVPWLYYGHLGKLPEARDCLIDEYVPWTAYRTIFHMAWLFEGRQTFCGDFFQAKVDIKRS